MSVVTLQDSEYLGDDQWEWSVWIEGDEVYDRAKDSSYDDSEMDPSEAYPLVDEVMADDDARDPTLESYQGES